MGNLFFYILLLFQGSVNRFFVKGEGSILYTHNNGKLANDPKLACQNFLSALERIPKVIATHEKELAKATKDIDVYKTISTGVWNKEDELRNIKAQAAELDRKIALPSILPRKRISRKKGNRQGIRRSRADSDRASRMGIPLVLHWMLQRRLSLLPPTLKLLLHQRRKNRIS